MNIARFWHPLLFAVLSLGQLSGVQAQTFQSSNRLVLGTELNKSASVRMGDLDGDNDLDVVVANGRHWPQQNFAFLNQGRAQFKVMRPIGVDRSTSYACELADLDGDGDLDVAVGNDMAPCQIFLNDGKANFTLHENFGGSSSVRSLTIADMDGDSDQDILLTRRGRANQIYLNDGHAKFEKAVEFGTKSDSTIDVGVGDVDADGDTDLVLANRDGQPNTWLLNDGSLKFDEIKPFGDPKSQSRAVVVGDFNKDGKLDWAIGNIGGPNNLFLGDGAGGVASTVTFGSDTGRTYCLASDDIDLDGDLDLVAGNVAGANAAYFNNGDGESFRTVTFGAEDQASYGVCLGDVNADGSPDIAVANSDDMNRILLTRIDRRAKSKAASVNKSKRQQKTSEPAATAMSSLDKFQNRREYKTQDWPAFRGLGGRGVAEGFKLPTNWNADPDAGELKNVKWQIDVPGLGHSSPVVVGEKLLLLTAVAQDGAAPLKVESGGKPTAADDNGVQQWLMLCYEKTTGKELWRKTLHEGKPKATRHTKATHANTSVCVAGKKVITFLGSEGLYCHDLDGNQLWKQDLGVINISKYGIGWGFSSSPAVHEDHIVLVCDDPENPFLTARDLKDGSEVWRTSRKDICQRSWGTPLVHGQGSDAQVVVNGWPWMVSYGLDDGKEVWRIKGGGDNPVPSPFEANGLIFVTNAHGGPAPIHAVRPNAKGELDPTKDDSIVWSVEKGGCYMSTPVVYDDQIYLGNSNGILRAFNSKTGERLSQLRLGRKAGVIASLVAGDGKIYCASENGTVYVFKHGSELKPIAENKMGDPCLATPAISEGVIFIRTTKQLTAIK